MVAEGGTLAHYISCSLSKHLLECLHVGFVRGAMLQQPSALHKEELRMHALLTEKAPCECALRSDGAQMHACECCYDAVACRWSYMAAMPGMLVITTVDAVGAISCNASLRTHNKPCHAFAYVHTLSR